MKFSNFSHQVALDKVSIFPLFLACCTSSPGSFFAWGAQSIYKDAVKKIKKQGVNQLLGFYLQFCNFEFCRIMPDLVSEAWLLCFLFRKVVLKKAVRGHQKLSSETNYIDLWLFWGVLGAKNRSKRTKIGQKVFKNFDLKLCWYILDIFLINIVVGHYKCCKIA